MTYKKYSEIMARRSKIIRQRRSLEMTIRMNRAWLTNKNSTKGKKRLSTIEEAEKKLKELPPIPPRPKHPIGYEVIDSEGDFVGFFPTEDRKSVEDYLMETCGHLNFKLNPKPRFRDD